jgi:DNA-binding LacI/PurR family transcriptional regulator
MGASSSTPTVKDIAARAKVSVGTVSRVLNRHQDVDAKLRMRVEAAVLKLGYRLNSRTHVHAKSRIVGLILCNDPGLSSAQSLLLLGVEEYCARAGYCLLFARHQFATDTAIVPGVIGAPSLADCLIVTGAISRNVLAAFAHRGFHCVPLANHLVEPIKNGFRSGSVEYNDQGGCYEATRYLVQLGHTAIWYIGDASQPWHKNRYQGYARAMAELGLEPHAHTIALSDDEFENGEAAVSYILEQGWPVTAILAASDDLAFGARAGLRQHRREVPKDVSLIGFEYRTDHSRGSNLTSVCVDMIEVGRELARLAIAQIESRQQEDRDVTVPAVFVKRSTCRPLRREEHMLL